LSFSFHRFSFLSRESGLRVVTPPEWIIFLCILRLQGPISLKNYGISFSDLFGSEQNVFCSTGTLLDLVVLMLLNT
jgi:hypothetical protein